MKPLFTFQAEGAAWLCSRQHALLADEMGLGKTRQVIAAADRVKPKSILVICPAIARINWAREFEEWSETGVRVKPVFQKREIAPDFAVVSYDYVAQGAMAKRQYDLVVVDEAHYLKSHDAKRTKSVYGSQGLVHKAKHFWALTGTPMPNHPGELWPMLFTFGVTKLKYQQFIERYCNLVVDGYGTRIVGSKRQMIPELKTLLKKVMLRRTKDRVMQDLPELVIGNISVEGAALDAGVLDKYFFDEFHGDKKAVDAQVAADKAIVDRILFSPTTETEKYAMLAAEATTLPTLRRYTGLQKVQPTFEIIEAQFAQGVKKLVVFAMHRAVIETLALKLKASKIRPFVVYGGTGINERQAAIDAFNDPTVAGVFIGQIQACGTAISLTAANHILFMEQSWVPGDNAQAIMRCHRIGQKRGVLAQTISLADSVDEHVNKVLTRKTKEILEIFS